MGGGMEANKNKFIEEWGSARENLEYNFRWTRRNFALVGLFGIAIPILVYKGIVKEFVYYVDYFSGYFMDNMFESDWLWQMKYTHMQDEDAGRPHRKFL